MSNSVKTRAEEQFAASQKKTKEELMEKDNAARTRSEKTVRLKALRLAKEAADAKEEAKIAAQTKTKTKTKAKVKAKAKAKAPAKAKA